MRVTSPKHDFSPFYSREYHGKRSEGEEAVLFRWFQLLENRFQLFNVHNKHDCLREHHEERVRAARTHQPPQPVVVQPFLSVCDFYGCVRCGKYHFCRTRRESCPLITDRVDKQKTCAYSGRLLPIQDNLEGTFDDDRRADKEAHYYSLPAYLVSSGTLKKRSSPKKSSPNAKKPYKSHIMDLFKEKDIPTTTPSLPTTREKKPTTKIDYRPLISNLYDLSIESSEEEDVEDVENERPMKRPRLYGPQEATSLLETDGYHEEGDEDTEMVCNTTATADANVIHDHETSVGPGYEEEQQEDEDGGEDQRLHEKDWLIMDPANEESGDENGDVTAAAAVEQDNENGEGSHSKTYHNNIRYKNEYYDFLRAAISKQKQTAQQQQQERTRYDKFMDLYRRDMREDEAVHGNPEKPQSQQPQQSSEYSDEHIATPPNHKLGNGICERIEGAVEIIVKTLLSIDPVKRPHCQLKKTFIIQRLTAYYVRLVKNITLLVYQSPVLNKLALDRSAKNQNAVSKFTHSEVDIEKAAHGHNDIDCYEYTLCPVKIARSLMLDLLVQPFSLTDVHGYRILVWGRDEWLRRFTSNKDRHLMSDYHHAISRTAHHPYQDLARFKKDVLDTSTLITDSLVYYKFCPLWLRDMVLQMGDPA